MVDTTLPNFTIPNMLLDFGPPLEYEMICTAYTVEKITLWEYAPHDQRVELVAIKAREMPRARAEGTLYRLTDEEMFSLDKKRGVGYNYTRKEHTPVIVPYNGEDGEFLRTYAHIYMGRKEYWVPKIGSSTANHPLHGGTQNNSIPKFRLAQQVYDPDPVLDNRYSFIQYPRPKTLLKRPPLEVVEAVLISNEETMLIRKEMVRKEKWSSFKRSLYSFVND